MSKWMENVRKVTPYVPGEQPKCKDIVKLNTNENPYPPSPSVLSAIKEMGNDELVRYPDPAATKLVGALARYHGVDEDMVFVGIGSDDVLAMAFMTFFNSDKPLLFPDITYSFYKVWAGLFNISYNEIPVDEDFSIRTSDYCGEKCGIIFPNPNAPTGIFMPVDTVKKLLDENKDVVVIVDEAYIDFGGESVMPLVGEYDNLLVVRTYSKSRALAGLRIGYAVGNRELIAAMNNVRYSYNSYTITPAAVRAGVASLNDEKYFREKLSDVIATRERVKEELSSLGFTFPDSMANFIFARPSGISAKELFEKLREKGIFVRYFSGKKVCDYLRISIGSDGDMDRFIGAVKEILE